VELELKPAVEEIAEPTLRPTLKGFADLAVSRFPARILLVRKAPAGERILVVTSGNPAELRNEVEGALADFYGREHPTLHMMEQEEYRALSAFLPPPAATPEEEVYRAPSMPSPAGPDGRRRFEVLRQKARSGETILSAVQALVDLGQKQVVEAEL
jgi:hypothetical protein